MKDQIIRQIKLTKKEYKKIGLNSSLEIDCLEHAEMIKDGYFTNEFIEIANNLKNMSNEKLWNIGRDLTSYLNSLFERNIKHLLISDYFKQAIYNYIRDVLDDNKENILYNKFIDRLINDMEIFDRKWDYDNLLIELKFLDFDIEHMDRFLDILNDFITNLVTEG